MSYKQLTNEERFLLVHYKRQGLNYTKIAEMLGRNKSTISRELRRNVKPYDGYYRYEDACYISATRKVKSRKIKMFYGHRLERVIALLKEDLSPKQVSGRLKRNREFHISHETIYRYIWDDKHKGGDLYTHLRGSKKKRRKRYRSNDSRGKLAGKRPIETRPVSADNRSRLGHWEADTVVSSKSKDCILTLVERKTGVTIIGKLKDRTKKEVVKCMVGLIRKSPYKFKTITADNGTEFHAFKKIEKMTKVLFYFANAYHSWERGTNENTNGLIRQYIPKKMCMKSVTQNKCNHISEKLNNRPRERYDFRTPTEVYYGL